MVVRATLDQRDDGPWVIVAVEDAGVGFGQDEAARLFEAFYTTKPGGLGMGLSIKALPFTSLTQRREGA